MSGQSKLVTSVLVVPGLFKAEDLAQNEFSSVLYSWLKRSQSQESNDFFYPLIMRLFGYDDYITRYDWASLRARHDNLDRGRYWLCADPIHLSVDVAHVYSLGNAYFELTLDEAQAYIDYLNQHLPLGSSLCLGNHPLQWYINLDKYYQFDLFPPDCIFGKTLVDKMPKGPDSAFALSLYNDIQMLLYGCDLNHQRRLAGRPTIDALWLWGAGKKIGPSSNCSWSQVVSNNDIILELAKLNDIDCISLIENQTDLADLFTQNGSILIVDDRYQFIDSAQKPYHFFSPKWLKNIKELYPGNSKRYVQEKGVITFLRRVLSI